LQKFMLLHLLLSLQNSWCERGWDAGGLK